MLRRLMLICAAFLLPVGFVALTTTSSSASTPKYDNSQDNVQCASFFGTAKVSPELTGGTVTSETTITIKGVLDGCTDGNGALTQKGTDGASPFFDAKVSGELNGASNSLDTLNGCSQVPSVVHPLKISWAAQYWSGASPIVPYAANTEYNVLDNSSTFTPTQLYGAQLVGQIPADLNSSLGAIGAGGYALSTEGFGEFELGAAADNPALSGPCHGSDGAVVGGFLGNDNGTGTASIAITSQDVNGILFGEEDASNGTYSTLNLGLGDIYVG